MKNLVRVGDLVKVHWHMNDSLVGEFGIIINVFVTTHPSWGRTHGETTYIALIKGECWTLYARDQFSVIYPR